jgi:hypothetical protein
MPIFELWLEETDSDSGVGVHVQSRITEEIYGRVAWDLDRVLIPYYHNKPAYYEILQGNSMLTGYNH